MVHTGASRFAKDTWAVTHLLDREYAWAAMTKHYYIVFSQAGTPVTNLAGKKRTLTIQMLKKTVNRVWKTSVIASRSCEAIPLALSMPEGLLRRTERFSQ